MWLIGREKTKSGPDKGKMVPSVNRKIDLEKIAKVRSRHLVQNSGIQQEKQLSHSFIF